MNKFRIPSRSSCLLVLSLLVVPMLAACESADRGEEAANDQAMAMQETDGDQTIADLAASYQRHYNLGHAPQAAALYTDSAVVLMADGTIARGRSEIEAYLAGQMASGNPQLSVDLIDTKVMGDTALSIGTWHVTAAPAGADTVHAGGHWMGVYQHTPEGWKAMAVITNYDTVPTPDMLEGQAPAEPPAENSAMGALADAYETAWSSGAPASVAALYADDAWASFASQPVAEGRAAITAALKPRVRGKLEIHGVKSVDLGDGWAADGGWYLVTGGDQPAYQGNYLLLARVGADGTPRIQWLVSNGRPAAGG